MRPLVRQLAVLGTMSVLLTLPLACVDPGPPDAGTQEPGPDASVPPLSLGNLGPHLIRQGARLDVRLQADGGTPPYAWELDSSTSDSALTWVHLDPSTSSLTGFAGQPTEGAKAVVVVVRDQRGSALQGQLLIDVEACLDGSTQACMWSSAEEICVVGVASCENGAIDLTDCVAPDGGAQPSDDLLLCGAGCGVCDLDKANACVGGVCACGDGGACAEGSGCCWTTVVRACFDLQTSVDHCGTCTINCAQFKNAVRSCTAGTCGSTCEAGWARCPPLDPGAAGDCETHIAVDVQNCGECGRICPASDGGDYPASVTCSNEVCGLDCGSGRQCGAACFNLNNPAHCGGCNTPCSAAVPHAVSATCTGTGTCVLACEDGWADCDGVRANGCEVDLTSDSAHCGQCFRPCQGTYNVCSARECVQACGPLKCSAPEICNPDCGGPCDPPTPCPSIPCCE